MRVGRTLGWIVAGALIAVCAAGVGRADDDELQQLKAAVGEMQRTIDAMKAKIDRLEREAAERATPSAVVAAAPTPSPAIALAMPPPAEEAAEGYAESVITSQGIGPQQPIDPQMRGFVPVPFTKALIRFNAKPRVDFTFDTGNAGDDNRFITAKIPVTGNPLKGGGEVFNVNGKGSQLMVDVRAPGMAGSPRFYYQNDFFGSGGGEFNLRVQHLYGSIYDVTVGQTFSPFEDPDIWPDTVDYEGPNAMIFARFPLVRYRLPLPGGWELNGGITQPESQVSDYDGEPVEGVNHAPDFAFNLRGASDTLGHVQLSTVFRDIGARSLVFGDDEVFGWGINAAGSLLVTVPWQTTPASDLLMAQLTYGEGIGRYGNDSGFFDTDAAFDSEGALRALPYVGAFAGYTHRWAADWRSTFTYGFVNVDGRPSQGADAFHQTQYGSLNLIWQLRERLSVGVEALYGDNQKESRHAGDVFRTQVGVAYSLF